MGIYTKSVKENSDSEAPNKPGSDVESVVSEGTVSDGSGVLLLPKEIRPKTNQKATVVVQKDAGLAVPKRGKSGVRQLRFRRERARATCVRVLCCLMFVCSVAVVIVSAVGLLQHLRLFPRLGYLPFVGRVGPVPHGPVPHGSDGYHRHLDLTGKLGNTEASVSHCIHRRHDGSGCRNMDIVHDTRTRWSAIVDHKAKRCLLFFPTKVASCQRRYPWNLEIAMGTIPCKLTSPPFPATPRHTVVRRVFHLVSTQPMSNTSCAGKVITDECSPYPSYRVAAVAYAYRRPVPRPRRSPPLSLLLLRDAATPPKPPTPPPAAAAAAVEQAAGVEAAEQKSGVEAEIETGVKQVSGIEAATEQAVGERAAAEQAAGERAATEQAARVEEAAELATEGETTEQETGEEEPTEQVPEVEAPTEPVEVAVPVRHPEQAAPAAPEAPEAPAAPADPEASAALAATLDTASAALETAPAAAATEPGAGETSAEQPAAKTASLETSPALEEAAITATGAAAAAAETEEAAETPVGQSAAFDSARALKAAVAAAATTASAAAAAAAAAVPLPIDRIPPAATYVWADDTTRDLTYVWVVSDYEEGGGTSAGTAASDGTGGRPQPSLG